jgi:hypothetical protein
VGRPLPSLLVRPTKHTINPNTTSRKHETLCYIQCRTVGVAIKICLDHCVIESSMSINN